MTASAVNSPETRAAPAFVILSDLQPNHPAWASASRQVEDVRAASARVFGFDPDVRLEPIGEMRAHPGRETFVIPAALDFSLWERDALGQRLAETRREHPDILIHHDDVDPGHPLLIDALGCQAVRALGDIPPQKSRLILAASGHGDPESRAQSYRLMRLLWERFGFARAEVAFVRHAQPFLAHVLERFADDTVPGVVVFQAQWETEHVEYARVMLDNFRRSQGDTPHWRFAEVPASHPSFTAWYAQRITRLWQEKRARESVRVPSAKRSSREEGDIRGFGCGIIARTNDRDSLREALDRIMPEQKPERVLVKVTWHGYATGTYTDPAALDLLLSALPAPAVILEGHTSSRNLGGAQFDWEAEAQANRAWIRQQEAEYLRRTGLGDVLARHDAQYVNVTEAYWDEDNPGEPAKFVPKALLDLRGCPMLSFAKFKGPTRLGISNLFGLIPAPLRSAWHGPNITWFARACCDLAKLYGSLFELHGMVEGLYSAVRWNRRGLYRSRWGNYDLIRDAGCVTASRGIVAADILAARLQGQDVYRSAFFDVVREDLGWDTQAADEPLPADVRTIFT
jgi:hypothetical protein